MADEGDRESFDAAAMRLDLARIKERLQKLNEETQSAFDKLQLERDDTRRRRQPPEQPPAPPAA